MDRVLRCRILQKASESILWMNAYTADQFGPELPSFVRVDEDFLHKAGKGEFVFSENRLMHDAEENDIEGVILYRWNRDYPADLFLDFDASLWKLRSTEDFAGSSHDKITEEIYCK